MKPRNPHLDLARLLVPLANLGFKSHEHEPHFGTRLDHVVYLHRASTHDGRAAHTYLHLITYDGQLVEVVGEVYLAPKNTRTPKGRDSKGKDAKWSDWQMRGFANVRANLIRTNAEVLAFCA